MKNMRIFSVNWTISGTIIKDMYTGSKIKLTCFSANFPLETAARHLASIGIECTVSAEAKGLSGLLLSDNFITELKL